MKFLEKNSDFLVQPHSTLQQTCSLTLNSFDIMYFSDAWLTLKDFFDYNKYKVSWNKIL